MIPLKNPAACSPTICIVGPTSAGKSTLAAEVARHLNGEIVGIDAFQLYRGLPILTAQSPSAEVSLSSKLADTNGQVKLSKNNGSIAELRALERSADSQKKTVPQHLIGVLSPTEECDAMRYSSMASPLLHEIRSRGKTPLLVGGTGFYLRALLSPLDILPAANADLRAKFATASHGELLSQLEQLDPRAPSQIDTNNRRRLERVLEILLLTGKPLAEVWKKNKNLSSQASATLKTNFNGEIPLISGLFLTRHREDLYQRIETHVRLMFDQGVVAEVANLDHLVLSRTASMTLGLREIQAHLKGEMTLPATIEAITKATKRYAKRQ